LDFVTTGDSKKYFYGIQTFGDKNNTTIWDNPLGMKKDVGDAK